MEDSIYELPLQGDKLFISSSSGLFSTINRIKGLNNENSQLLIIEGYRLATIELLKKILILEEPNNLETDSLIYPILFNFRHYIESTLKDILRKYRIINKIISTDEIGYIKIHSLFGIWNDLKVFIESEPSSMFYESIESAERILTEIEELDKNSFSFRYAFKGENNIKNKLTYSTSALSINLANLEITIKKMMNFLEQLNDAVTAELDFVQSEN